MTRRSNLEIYCDMLQCVYLGIRRTTHIMYNCNLSWDTMKPRLKELVDNGLLTYTEPYYGITDKGIKAVKAYLLLHQLTP